MQNKTPQNLIGYLKNPKTSKLLNVIDYSINSFCQSLGFKKNFFSQFLNYSDSQFPKYINPKDDSHNLKITDLELILLKLDSQHKKIILDSLCQNNGFVCVDTANEISLFSNLEILLLNISATNGDLAKTFLSAVEDGNINELEKQQLKTISYQLREFLITFENRILETK
uniref:phage regulatory CII family protein n=1 Tax=Aliarcobacter sp. TaxID=2321116 RepID=UPI004047D1CB